MTKEIAIKALIGNGETLNLPGTIKKKRLYLLYFNDILRLRDIRDVIVII